jgi:hypothetical protein
MILRYGFWLKPYLDGCEYFQPIGFQDLSYNRYDVTNLSKLQVYRTMLSHLPPVLVFGNYF